MQVSPRRYVTYALYRPASPARLQFMAKAQAALALRHASEGTVRNCKYHGIVLHHLKALGAAHHGPAQMSGCISRHNVSQPDATQSTVK